MKDTSPVQKIITWAVVILLVILLVSVLMNDKGTPYTPTTTPIPTVSLTPTPTMTVYPSNGKE